MRKKIAEFWAKGLEIVCAEHQWGWCCGWWLAQAADKISKGVNGNFLPSLINSTSDFKLAFSHCTPRLDGFEEERQAKKPGGWTASSSAPAKDNFEKRDQGAHQQTPSAAEEKAAGHCQGRQGRGGGHRRRD
jgi:hypothetical protein